MSDLPAVGSLDKPVRLDPWQRIIEVGWGGGIAIVEVTAPEIKFYQVSVLDPVEWFDDIFGGGTITLEDYKDSFVVRLGTAGSAGTVVVEDALNDVWIWDGFLIGNRDDDAINLPGVAAGNAAFGYGANIHLVGEQVAYDTTSGRPRLGDYVTHTHPNGATTFYSNGYTPLGVAYSAWHGPNEDFFGVAIRSSDPNGFPEPPQDLSNTESWYWRRITTRPQGTAALLRRSYLVNFRTNFSKLADLHDFEVTLEHPLEWSIKGYPSGTAFTIADGIATPVGNVLPRFNEAGTVPGSHSGQIRKFTGTGFVP